MTDKPDHEITFEVSSESDHEEGDARLEVTLACTCGLRSPTARARFSDMEEFHLMHTDAVARLTAWHAHEVESRA